jgi:hypothetical protein
MLRSLRTASILLMLCTLLVTGCDSGTEGRSGSFVVDIRGDVLDQLNGSAELIVQSTNGTPNSFDLILTSQRSEILIQSAAGSGLPEETTYAVDRSSSDGSPTVSVEYDPDRFTPASELFIAQSGTVTITRVTDVLVEGRFNVDALGTNDATREVILVGEFTAQR